MGLRQHVFPLRQKSLVYRNVTFKRPPLASSQDTNISENGLSDEPASVGNRHIFIQISSSDVELSEGLHLVGDTFIIAGGITGGGWDGAARV